MRGPLRLLVTCSTAVLVVGSAAAAAGATVHGAIASVPKFTLTISGIDRNGTHLPVSATVYGQNGVDYLNGGSSVKVPPGTYEVAASIWQSADGDSQTLVAATVHVTGNKHVTLDAVGAVPVSATINVPSLTQGNQTIQVCIKAGGIVNALGGFQLDSAGAVYVKPMKATDLRTVYQTYYQGTGTVYDVAGAFSGGIPGQTVYKGVQSAMAKVDVQLRDYENVTPLQYFITSYDGCGSMNEPEGLLPAVYTNYRTPGTWNVNENFGPTPSVIQKDTWITRTYQAGHTYSEVYNNAVTGPAAVYPEIQGSAVVYSPSEMLNDPFVNTGSDCEGRATVTLHRLATLIKSQKLTFCGNPFSAHVAKAGWVTLTANAARWNPGGSLPAGFLLSTQVGMTWHFRFAAVTGHPINVQAAPVTVTKFEPQGLSSYNDALGGTSTSVRIYILRGGGEPVATPRYRLRAIKIQVSFNDGKTWKTISAKPHIGYWVAAISNPVTTGYVSLRSIVTDVHGDSTTETIIRAYLVENAG